MKKLISLSAALMLGICAFAGCGKDSSSSESSSGSDLTGKWEVTKYTVDDKEETTIYEGVPIAVGLQFELKEDGKAIGWDPMETKEEEIVAKWTLDGDKLTLGEDKETTTSDSESNEEAEDETEAVESQDMVFDVKDGKLIYTEEEDGHKSTIELSKVDSYTSFDFDSYFNSYSSDDGKTDDSDDSEATTEAETTEAE